MKKLQLFSQVIIVFLIAPQIGLSQANTQITNPSTTRGLGVNNNFSGNSDRVGVYSYSVNNPGFGYGTQSYGGYYGVYSAGQGGNYTGSVHGVYGTASGVGGSCFGVRYGVRGFASGGNSNYGVYGSTSDNCGTAFDAAGYFSGAVYAVSYNVISDRKFKTGITAIKNPLDQLMKLKPAAYQFKQAEYGKMGLVKGNQMGLIADEVKQVFPELVTQAVSPAEYDENKAEVTPSQTFETVNYVGLIPVLIASVQEQQKTIAVLKTENEELKARLDRLETGSIPGKSMNAISLSSASLKQNSPNPFNKTTVISYYLPEQTGNAVVNISDLNGKVIKSIRVTQKGQGQLSLEAGQLNAGTYQYSFIVNGKVVDTKKMVLTR